MALTTDIAHRDLKLDNIMLAPTPEDPLVIKARSVSPCAPPPPLPLRTFPCLAVFSAHSCSAHGQVTDFGLCAVKGKDMPEMAMVCGTPSYMGVLLPICSSGILYCISR